ncbi:MAG: M20/M25/M40 family metallo-hydrolase [Gemmatimonadota bacterium]|nr:MAG: M20/M25/M40 family metallo-hydrolase [Gemmatimonadota bacterium]
MRGPRRPSCRLLPGIIALLAASAATPAHPQQDPTPQEPPASPIAGLVAGALDAPELPVMAAGLIDTIGGRLSGTPVGTRAEAWAAGWLRSLGADSVWYEVVHMPTWRRGTTEVRVVSPAAVRHHKLAAITYGYSPGIAADSLLLIDIGRGDTPTLEGLGPQAEGAVLLTDVVSPEVVAAAAEIGAAALLRVSLQPGRLPQARVTPTPERPAPLPILALSREDGLWLRRLLATGPLTLRLQVEAETRQGTAANVVAEWWGSDPAADGEVVLLGAHLDAWDLGAGALDNGTGVLAVMTAARAIAAAPTRPRRTVRIVLFAGEELGLLGSREYVEVHAETLANIVAMMNLDMVGAPQGYGATGHDEADTLFARLGAEPALRDLGLTAEVNHGGGPGSDHQHFLLAGVPTIYVRSSLPEDAPRWYHNAGDTLDKIDLEAVQASAAAAAAAVWALADHPGRPLRHLSLDETRELIGRLGW